MTLGRNAKDELSDIMGSINEHIELADYIIKSPPKEKQNNALVRWCMRWFVIYYNRAQHKCWLLYFENENAFLCRKLPKGKIDLKLSKIKEHKTALNKYKYVIDVIALKRTFHLCFLNRKIYQRWLTTLKDLHTEVWSCQVQQNTTNNDNNNNNAADDAIINDRYGNHDNHHQQKEDDDQPYLDTLKMNDIESRDDKYIEGENDLIETLQIHDNDDVDDTENDDVFDEQSSISSSKRSSVASFQTPPNFSQQHRNSIDVGDAMRSQHQHRQSPFNNNNKPTRSTTIPKDINQLLLQDTPKYNKRYASLQEVSTTHWISISPLNIHLEMLQRLEKAAAKRPLSDGSDYDMGGFTGPRFNYLHK